MQDDVATCFDYYAGLAEKLDGQQMAEPIDVGMAEFDVRVRKEALGVVALITPWNYPMLMATVGGPYGWVGAWVLSCRGSLFDSWGGLAQLA